MNGIQEVRGSIPLISTRKYRIFGKIAGIAVLFSPVAFRKVAGKIVLLHTYYTLYKIGVLSLFTLPFKKSEKI